jgi:serine/threonine protein kinase
LYYQQSFIAKIKFKKFKKRCFNQVVDALTYFEKIGFIHGDINRKNILYDAQRGFVIVDYEPSLLQIINGVKKYIVTQPYISKLDIEEKRITVRTDKIGFFYFVLRSLEKINDETIINLSKTLEHRKVIGMSDSEIEDISYDEILNLAWAQGTIINV